MLELHQFDKRFVIPKWLPFIRAVRSGELSIPRQTDYPVDKRSSTKLAEDYKEFQVSHSETAAFDLMGSAYVIGQLDIAKEAARTVLACKSAPGPSLRLARAILNMPEKLEENPTTKVMISSVRRGLSDYPNNPFAWIELGRLFTIAGQPERATKAVLCALAMSPCDRYIVRSAIRFFIHVGNPELAWHHAAKALSASFDPWIYASFMNLSLLMEKKLRRKDLQLALSPAIPKSSIFHYSELLETSGIIELENGNERRAKRQFRLAWMSPSENVVTHGEWIIRSRLPDLSEQTNLNLADCPEAMTWHSYWQLKLNEAAASVREWALEEPYSRHPWILGSSIFCGLRNYGEAARFARQGLLANPDDFLLVNNLSFALLKSGEIDSAEKLLMKSPKPSAAELPVYLATRGLLAYEKKNWGQGRDLYWRAIRTAEGQGNDRLTIKAFINMAIAELKLGSDKGLEMKAKAIDMAKAISDPGVIADLRLLE